VNPLVRCGMENLESACGSNLVVVLGSISLGAIAMPGLGFVSRPQQRAPSSFRGTQERDGEFAGIRPGGTCMQLLVALGSGVIKVHASSVMAGALSQEGP